MDGLAQGGVRTQDLGTGGIFAHLIELGILLKIISKRVLSFDNVTYKLEGGSRFPQCM